MYKLNFRCIGDIWDCPVCGTVFDRPSLLAKHLESIHVDHTDGRIPCPNCPARLVRSSIRTHMTTFHTFNAVCSHCGFTCNHKQRFIFHMMTKHNDLSHGEVPIHRCDRCDYYSIAMSTLMKHVRHVHEGNEFKVFWLVLFHMQSILRWAL